MICAWYSKRRTDWHNWSCDISIEGYSDKNSAKEMLMSGIITSYENGKYAVEFDEFLFGNAKTSLGEIAKLYPRPILDVMISDCYTYDINAVGSEYKNLYKLLLILNSFFNREKAVKIFNDDIAKVSFIVENDSLLNYLLERLHYSDCGENLQCKHCWQTNW